MSRRSRGRNGAPEADTGREEEGGVSRAQRDGSPAEPADAAGEATGATGPEAGGESPAGELAELPEAEVLLVELERARDEIASLNDRLLRLAAEFDNFRKRTAREREDFRVQAQADIARAVVPALDDLARWRDLPDETTTVEALDRGLDLIRRNLEKALAEHGLQRVEAEGAPFDPEVHQALRVEPAERPEEDETVGRVFAHGYRLRGFLVRPAQVEVRRWEGEADAPAAVDEADDPDAADDAKDAGAAPGDRPLGADGDVRD
ncbi:MAG: nucleotide exchange factor GrpE [Gemmatimonadota bacterium]|nr:nucleotide exchange factor GrpE [Gemmatimonadota bacterium]